MTSPQALKQQSRQLMVIILITDGHYSVSVVVQSYLRPWLFWEQLRPWSHNRRDAGQLNEIFGSNFDDFVRIFPSTEGSSEQSLARVIKNNFPSLSSGRNALLQSDTHRRWWSIMKSYKHERHAQSAPYFYLQTLNEHEVVPELFEQAQPCMNSARKNLFFALVSLLGLNTKSRVQEILSWHDKFHQTEHEDKQSDADVYPWWQAESSRRKEAPPDFRR